jgi:CheY-like chemotaxis protein
MAIQDNAVILLEDDADDREFFALAFEELGYPNDLKIFEHPDELIYYLKNSDHSPFFILSDYNLPKQNGFDTLQRLRDDEEIHYKSVPYLLWSTTVTNHQLREAYDKSVQGFFVKPSSYTEVRELLKMLFHYWSTSQHPKEI